MQPNNNLSSIPFYKDIAEQDFRKWYAYGEKYPHRVPSDWLVPFYFVVPLEMKMIDSVEFYRVCCDDGQPVTGSGSFNIAYNSSYDRGDGADSYETAIIANNLEIREYDDFSEVIYFASHNNPIDLPKGLYYIAITLSNYGADETTYYSEVFFADTEANLLADGIKVEYWCESDITYENDAFIPYGESAGNYFKSMLYLATDIGKPTYEFTEEGDERNGFFFPTKQISTKAYNFFLVAPEYLCDCMRIIRLADRVKITDRLQRVYDVEQFEMEITWTEQGHYANANCMFKTDTIVKKVGKAYNNISER